jgi:hypothetical protein
MRSNLILAAGFLLSINGVAQAQMVRPVGSRILELETRQVPFTRMEPFTVSTAPAERDTLIGAVLRGGTFMTLDADVVTNLLDRSPERLALILPSVNGPVELHLEKAGIFFEGFTLVTASTGAPVASAPGSHYRGIIAGHPGTLAAISIFPDEVMGVVSDEEGDHVLGKLGGGGNQYIYYATENLVHPPILACATPDDGHGYTAAELTAPADDRSAKCVRLYWEVNYDIFQGKGGLINTTNYITGLFNQSAALYENDGVSVLLSQLYIWDVTSPYTSTSSSGLLTQFKNYRNSFNGDLAHLMGYAGGGGIAAGFSGLCSSNLDNSMCYSGIHSDYSTVPTYSWSVEVVTHEQGHLLGSRHTHACVWNGNSTAIDGCGPSAGYGYEGTCSGAPIPSGGGTIMSYCHLNAVGINFTNGFGPQPAAVILNNVEAAACLTSCTSCPAPAGLTISAISMIGAQCQWQPATSAVSYRLQWKPSASGQWNTIQDLLVTNTTLSGLTPDTDHDVRAGTVCSGGTVAYGPVTTFHTLQCMGAGGCDDGQPCTTDVCAAGYCAHVPVPDTDGDGSCDAIDPCPLVANLVPGDACDDGNSGTYGDLLNAVCVCGGTPFGSLQQFAKVVANDRGAFDGYGSSVALAADRGIVGAVYEDHDATGGGQAEDAGSAYVLVRNGNGWTQEQKITASDRGAVDHFGSSVAISGDYAIVGAMWEDENAQGTNGLLDPGSAYIFVRSGGSWVQQQKIVASDRSDFDSFGNSVAINGDYAVVAAVDDDEGEGPGSVLSGAGSIYVFVRNGSTWTQQRKLVPADRQAADRFGESVAIEGERIVVGARFSARDAAGNNPLSQAGAAYVFKRTGTLWTQEQKLVAVDRAMGDQFGRSVAISGDHVAVGAANEDENTTGGNTLADAGSAYVFHLIGGTWTQLQKLVAADREAGDLFGVSVGLHNDRLVVGAPNEDHDASGTAPATDAGAAYVFMRNGGTWYQQQKLVAGDRAAQDNFGSCVSMYDGRSLVGAYNEDEDIMGANTLNFAGSVYVQGGGYPVRVAVKVLLEGPYDQGSSLMSDALRSGGLLPIAEPYTALWSANAADGGNETVAFGALAVTGPDAIVDWVRLELRSPTQPGVVVATRHALLQRDGDVVSGYDGSSPVSLDAGAGNYHVAVRHRNHLGVMTAVPLALSGTPTVIDLRSPSTPANGTEARKQMGSIMVLWAGNVVPDPAGADRLLYTGSGNDRDPILVTVGSTTPNNVVSNTYSTRDVNMNGQVKYTGSSNDRDPILVNVGSTTPNNTRLEQLP